jgi:hypothetical protein
MEQRLPRDHEMKNVRSMAERLDDQMEKLGKRARKQGEDLQLSRRENEALRRVEMMVQRADGFKDTLERTPDRPSWSVDDFEKLLGAYLLVDESLETLYRSNMLNGEFRRVQDLMDDLVSYYGGYPPYGGREYERLTGRAEGDVSLAGDDEDVDVSIWRQTEQSELDFPDAHVRDYDSRSDIPREMRIEDTERLQVPDIQSPAWADWR